MLATVFCSAWLFCGYMFTLQSHGLWIFSNFSAQVDLGSEVDSLVPGALVLLGDDFRKMTLVMRQSTVPLPNYTHFLRENGLKEPLFSPIHGGFWNFFNAFYV